MLADLYPWQAALWQQLAGRTQHAHAYLLHGPAGIGKRAMAENLLAFLLCKNPVGLKACTQCKSCHLLAVGTHPDLHVLEPEEPGKAIRIDQVRELVGFVTQTPQLNGRKVVLLEPAEAMNPNAANALLKSLEEPAGDTVILLVSHQASRLLPTVRSRCVQQACPLPSEAESLDWLQQSLPQLDRSRAQQLLELAGNSPLGARNLLAQDVFELRAKVVEGIKQLLKHQIGASQLAGNWNSVPLPLLFDWFCQWSQALLRYQLTGDSTTLGPDDMHKVLQYLAERTPCQQVLAIQDWLLQQRQKVLGRANLNRLLLLEALLVQWASLVRPR